MGAALSEDTYIEAHGATLRVRSAGRGPAVVLVHGWALDMDMWRAPFELLANAGYHVIAFDRRGFGLSSGVPGIHHDVHDIGQVLDCFGISRAAIVGMSQGARVALRWALKHPERTSCLVLDGPPAEDWPQPLGAREVPIDDYRRRIHRDGIDSFRNVWLQHPFMKLHTTSPCAHLLLRDIVVRYPALDLLMTDLPEEPLLAESDLRRLSVPALVLSGEHDSAQRLAIARRMTQALPDARLKVLSGAGHLAALDNPSAYVRSLHDFFSTQSPMVVGEVM